MQVNRFRFPAIGIAALLVFAIAGCQSANQTADEGALTDFDRLETPSVAHYSMLDSQRTYGQMTQRLDRVEEQGRDLFRADYDVEGGVSGTSRLVFDAETGSPLRIRSTQKMRDMEATTEMVYEKGRVRRIMNSPARPGADTTYTDIPPDTKDWMQVGFLLQATELANVDTLRMPFYQGFGRAFVDTATLVNMGVDTVQVPAGVFDAYRIHIEFAGSQADFYVESGGENRVLRHEVPGRAGTLNTVLIPAPESGADTTATG